MYYNQNIKRRCYLKRKIGFDACPFKATIDDPYNKINLTVRVFKVELVNL